MAQARIEALYRYPVKGLSGQPISQTEIATGQCLAHDRAFAIEHSGRMFDPAKPEHLPKIRFAMLMRHARLASLETEYDEADATLTVKRDGKTVARGAMTTQIGCQILEQFFGAFLGEEIKGAPRIVSAPGHHFTDVAPPYLSLINLASVRDLERVIGAPVDPLRFRGNILVEGLEPWEEFQWIDCDIQTGSGPAFHGVQAITRCAATEVDPATGVRDLQIRNVLENSFGQVEMGIYIEATRGGTLACGDGLEAIEPSGQATDS